MCIYTYNTKYRQSVVLSLKTVPVVCVVAPAIPERCARPRHVENHV